METAYWVVFERRNKERDAKPFATREGALKWCNSTNHIIIAITTPINVRGLPTREELERQADEWLEEKYLKIEYL